MLHRKKDPPRSADSTPDRGSPHKSSHSTLSPSAQIVADTKDNEVAGAEIEAASSSSGSRSSGEEAQDEKCYKTPGAMETHSASLVPCSATPSVDTAEIPNIKPASGISNRAVTQKRTLKKWRACFGDDVDETQEQLIVRYQCNLQQESILVPGSLYISHSQLNRPCTIQPD